MKNRKIYKARVKKEECQNLSGALNTHREILKARKKIKRVITHKRSNLKQIKGISDFNNNTYTFNNCNKIYKFGLSVCYRDGLCVKFMPYVLKNKGINKGLAVDVDSVKNSIKMIKNVFKNFSRCRYCNSGINKGLCSLKSTGFISDDKYICVSCDSGLIASAKRGKNV